jgi:signal transduction histidine kinase
VIERDGQPVAALIDDPALQYNSELVDSVCAAAGLSLDNERLAAELRARLAELQASRARLVEATDTERRRLERDLHDGAQQQLVALKISLGLARQLVTSPPEAADLLTQTERRAAEALEEFRELARGICPSVLADLGLRAALEAQARGPRGRRPGTLPPLAWGGVTAVGQAATPATVGCAGLARPLPDGYFDPESWRPGLGGRRGR